MRSDRLGPFGAACALVSVLLGAGSALLGVCGPFTDVAGDVFCPFVLEIFYLGITTGTTPTTYDPSGNVTRLQMAAFLSRTVDGTLKRGSRRAALRQFWTSQGGAALGVTTIGIPGPASVIESDGKDLWTPVGSLAVARLSGSDGRLLETWTGVSSAANGVLSAMNRIFVTGQTTPGTLYMIEPSRPAGAVTTVSTSLGNSPNGIAFDGGRVWTANGLGSVSIITPGASIPWTTTTASVGFAVPFGALYDGVSVWVTDITAGTLLKLGPTGAILQTVTVGTNPLHAVFDGSNIWVPNFSSSSISIVRASSGAVVATLTGNGLLNPYQAAFDGQRVLVTDNGSVTLWKAADLSPMGFFSAGTSPTGVCSDGIGFWFLTTGGLARF